MRRLVFILTVLACASCDNVDGPTTNSLTSAPSVPAVVTQFAPGSLSLATDTAVPCGVGDSAFVVGFEVVLVPIRTVTLDRVTVNLLDGTNIGAPLLNEPFVFSRADLGRQFGSTLVAGTRSFPLEATFGCLSFVPRSMSADIFFVDQGGIERFTTVSAVFP